MLYIGHHECLEFFLFVLALSFNYCYNVYSTNDTGVMKSIRIPISETMTKLENAKIELGQ
jgi:hypothetical protein